MTDRAGLPGDATGGTTSGPPTPQITGSGPGLGGLASLKPGDIAGGPSSAGSRRATGPSTGQGSGGGGGGAAGTVPTTLTPEQEEASHSCGANRGEGGRDMEFWYVTNAATGSYWGCDLTVTALTDYYRARPAWKSGSAPISVDGFRCNHVPRQDSFVQVICLRDGDLIYSSWLP